jgi:purine-binding chemotaxis protein CheW
MSQTGQYSTFFVEQMHFGIGVDHVQEALVTMTTTPVPLTTDVVDGLINLRGQIVLAIDLRARLQLPRRAPDQPSVSLILRTSNGLISLRVDRLGDILDLDALTLHKSATASAEDDVAAQPDPSLESTDIWQSLPDTVRGPLRELAQGILQLDETLLLVLDPDLLANELNLAT